MLKKFTVIGFPLTNSRSPAIHKAFAKQFNLDIEYNSIEVTEPELAGFVLDFFSKGGTGLNITAPHKQQAYKITNTATLRAQFAGAVNTFKTDVDGSLYGENTDGVGLVRDLQRHGIAMQNKRILILGAGGATRGILPEIIWQLPSRITVVNRSLKKAQQIADDFTRMRLSKIQIADYRQIADQKYDLIINATAAGLYDQLPPFPDGFNFKNSCCYDLNYQAKAKLFTEYATANGAAKALDGLGMLVEQAAESFYFWHGLRPNTDAVLAQLH